MGDLQQIRTALKQEDFETARRLLVSAPKNSGEYYLLSALVATSDKEVSANMREALKLEPQHKGALALKQVLAPLPDIADTRKMSFESYNTFLLNTVKENLESILDAGGSPQPTDTYEMLWDCQFCGTKGNLGLTHRFCHSCGAPQDPDSRYFPSDAEKVAVHDHEFVGADVTCSSCNELNSAASEYCTQCGAPLTDGAKAKTLGEQSRAKGGSFASSGSRDVVKEKFEAEQRRVGNLPDKKKNAPSRGRIIAIVAVAVVVIIGIFAFFNAKKEVTLIVTGHEWERTASIEEYRNFTTQSWHDSRPAGDNVIRGSCREQQRGTRRVDTGRDSCRTVRTDSGDGTYREREVCENIYENVPVYDEMCTWTGQRWENDRTASASGDLSVTPTDPEYTLNCANQRSVGCERVSSTSERYTVLYEDTDSDATYRCDFDQNVWASISVESLWNGSAGRFVGGVECDTLQPAR